VYFDKFSIMYFRLFIKWKTENQLKTHLVYLFADKKRIQR